MSWSRAWRFLCLATSFDQSIYLIEEAGRHIWESRRRGDHALTLQIDPDDHLIAQLQPDSLQCP